MDYTFDDIQRYLQGKMTTAEMHAIEKAALQDPFLADAIEGFGEVSSSVAAHHLHEINAALSGRDNITKIVSFGRRSQWMRIAALIIVLAGAGIAGIYMFNKAHTSLNVAQEKNEKAATPDVPVLKDSTEKSVITESLKEESEKTTAKSELETIKNKTKPAPVKSTNELASGNQNDAADQQGDLARTFAPQAPMSKTEANQDKETYKSSQPFANQEADTIDDFRTGVSGLSAAPVTINGKIVDENNQPIPDVMVQSDDKKETVVSDFNGNFSLRKQDTLADVSAFAIGYANKEVKLKAGASNKITMLPDNATLDDVVIVGMGVKKSDTTNSRGVTPVGGWQNFNHYVQQQLNVDSAADPDEDLLELEFSIDKAGNPVNIRFLQALDPERNARAVDIIKQGPKWTTTGNKNVRLRISF